MGCKCKEKRVPPAQQPATIRITEKGTAPRPPEPITPPAEINKVVEKLNEILTPQQ